MMINNNNNHMAVFGILHWHTGQVRDFENSRSSVSAFCNSQRKIIVSISFFPEEKNVYFKDYGKAGGLRNGSMAPMSRGLLILSS